MVADERDVIRLRTTHRQPPEEVSCIAPTSLQHGRVVCFTTSREANHLVEQQAFYTPTPPPR